MSGTQVRKIVLAGLAIAIGVLLYVQYNRYTTGKERLQEDARRIRQLLQEQESRRGHNQPGN